MAQTRLHGTGELWAIGADVSAQHDSSLRRIHTSENGAYRSLESASHSADT